MYRRPSLLSDISSLAHSSGESVPSAGEWGTSPLDAIFAPRPLSLEETAELHALLKSTLKLTNCSCVLQAEEDAIDLLTYAFDLIGDGETVGDVLEELEFMELEICGSAVLDEMRVCLAGFLGRLDGGNQERAIAGRSQSMPLSEEKTELDPREAFQKFGRRNSLASQMRRAENHVSVDLSCKTAATKKQEEMEQLFGKGTRPSIKDRMCMYDDQGKLRASFRNTEGDADLDDVDDLKDQASIDAQRREELMIVMNDTSLTKNERNNKMGEVRAKYGLAEMKMKITQASKTSSASNKHAQDKGKKLAVPRAEKEMRGGRRSSVDLSAKSAHVKKAQELAALFGNSSLKDRMSMYDEQGHIVAKKEEEKVEEVNIVAKEKSLDEMRREELMVVMKEKSLNREEKAARMEDIKQKYSAIAAEKTQPQDTVKKIVKQASGQESRETPGRRLSQEDLDDHEREELQAILRDRTLCTASRKKEMGRVKGDYAVLSLEHQYDGSASVSSTVTAKIDLSAKKCASRRRASLEKLEQGTLMSLRERISKYNNSFVQMQ